MVTFSQVVNNVMGQLDIGVIDYDRLKYLITDAASYMISAGVTLKTLYPHLLHVTCAAHGIQRVIEEVSSKKCGLIIRSPINLSQTSRKFLSSVLDVNDCTKKSQFAITPGTNC